MRITNVVISRTLLSLVCFELRTAANGKFVCQQSAGLEDLKPRRNLLRFPSQLELQAYGRRLLQGCRQGVQIVIDVERQL